MNNLRDTTKQAVVKFLITVPAVALMLAGFEATAQTPQTITLGTQKASGKKDCLPYKADATAYADCLKLDVEEKKENNCNRLQEQASKARQEISKLCSDAGAGSGAACYSKAKFCSELSKDSDDPDTLSTMTNALYSNLGVTPTAKKKDTKGCPQYSSDGYIKRRKEINDELKEIKKDIADLKKEGTDLEKETQEDIKKAQKDVQEAQTEKQKVDHEIDDDVRDQVSKASENQGKLKQALTSNDLNIVKLRGQVMASESDKATKLIQINDSAVKDTCVANYQRRLDENQAMKMKSSLSFAQMKSLKASLLNAYQTCIKGFEQQRVTLMQAKAQEQAELRQQIIAAQGDMEETQRSIDLAQTQLNEIQAASKTKKTESANQLQQKMQTAQTSMQTASQNMQKQQANFATRNKELTTRMNDLNAELAAMGAEPDPDATQTPRKIASQISGLMQPIRSYQEAGCCSGKSDSLCNSVKEYEGARADDADPDLNAK